MRRIFDEYGTLALCYICSVFGFSILYKTIMEGEYIHNIIKHLLYGVL